MSSVNKKYTYTIYPSGTEIKGVSRSTAFKYWLFENEKLLHNIIYLFLFAGIIMYSAFYIYYIIEIKKLLNEPSATIPTFYCKKGSADDPYPCEGKGYTIDKATGEIKCPEILF